jgi:hypothetical protein
MYLDTIVNETLCQRYAKIANSVEGQQVQPFSTEVQTGSTDFGKALINLQSIMIESHK